MEALTLTTSLQNKPLSCTRSCITTICRTHLPWKRSGRLRIVRRGLWIHTRWWSVSLCSQYGMRVVHTDLQFLKTMSPEDNICEALVHRFLNGAFYYIFCCVVEFATKVKTLFKSSGHRTSSTIHHQIERATMRRCTRTYSSILALLASQRQEIYRAARIPKENSPLTTLAHCVWACDPGSISMIK